MLNYMNKKIPVPTMTGFPCGLEVAPSEIERSSAWWGKGGGWPFDDEALWSGTMEGMA